MAHEVIYETLEDGQIKATIPTFVWLETSKVWFAIGSKRSVERRVKRGLLDAQYQDEHIAEAKRYANAPKKKCSRCKGAGHIDHYLHVAHGVCFKCGGEGKVEK